MAGEAEQVAAGATATADVGAQSVAAAPADAALKSPLAAATVETVVEAPVEKVAEAVVEETPEAKTAREATEATAKETAKADLLKSYDTLKLPEGVPADQPAFGEFKAAAVDAGMTPEAAQTFLDRFAPELQKAVNAPYEQWATTVEGWVGEAKADKEYGGAAFKQNLALGARAIDTIMGKEAGAFRAMLDFTGAGYHPEMLRMMVRAGKTLAEGKPVNGGADVPQRKIEAADFYPSMKPTTAA